MKKSILFFLIAAVFYSCTEQNNDNQQVKDLEAQIEELSKKNIEKDSSINNALRTFNEIEQNLDEITKARDYININLANENANENEIISKIQFINSLLKQNEKKIAELKKTSKNKDLQALELKSLINNLNNKIIEQNTDIQLLKEELTKSEFKIEALNRSLDSIAFLNAINEQMIEMQKEQLQAAYYCIGFEKELKENNVITNEGGFIGLGKTSKMHENFNQDYFTEINIYTTTEIPINQKKVELLTTHNSNSYRLEKSGNIVQKIVIENPDEFWKASKYLVIKVK